jgi:hypothetical protein
VALDLTVTYDPDTDIGDVRASIQDIAIGGAGDVAPDITVPRSQWTAIFTDQEIQKKIDRHLDAVNKNDLAAADLLEDIASSQAQLAKLLTLGSYTSDTRTTAATLRSQAAVLRARYGQGIMAGQEEPAESITPEVWDDFSFRRSRYQTIPPG